MKKHAFAKPWFGGVGLPPRRAAAPGGAGTVLAAGIAPARAAYSVRAACALHRRRWSIAGV